MPRKSPFKHHRFPREIILRAVRWYLRYPLSYQDVVDLLAERGINVDRSTVYRWAIKFGPNSPNAQRNICAVLASIGTWMKPTSALAANGNTYGAPLIQTAKWWISASPQDEMRKLR